MALDRGTLAKIDRRVFAELGHASGTQAVKIPLSDAAWSTWRRYCQEIALTMGEAVAGLIDHELRMLAHEPTDADGPLFAGRREKELDARESRLVARERDLSEIEEKYREWTKRLGAWERELQARERRLLPASKEAVVTNAAGRKIGRNEQCPCGSRLKYKHCHGLIGHRTEIRPAPSVRAIVAQGVRP